MFLKSCPLGPFDSLCPPLQNACVLYMASAVSELKVEHFGFFFPLGSHSVTQFLTTGIES